MTKEYDGGLRRLFRKHLPEVHWTTIESRYTQSGIPDLNGCCDGVEFWIECKRTAAWTIKMRPMQMAWLLRRLRAGGNCWIAVRRRNKKNDELWLVRGAYAKLAATRGLRALPAAMHWAGGPKQWPWREIYWRLGCRATAGLKR